MMTEAQSAVVVIPGLDDDQLIISCAVDEAVLVVDSPGPEAGEIAAQRLWLAGALERGVRASSISRSTRRSIFLSAVAQ